MTDPAWIPLNARERALLLGALPMLPRASETDANEIEALRIISPENHMLDIYDRFDHHPEKIKFYQTQLKALVYVGDHQIKAAIPELILYLDYPTSGMEAGLKDPAHGPETDRAIKIWPAFGALFKIPGSGEAVRDYCLDPVHPMRYRLVAFEVLQFIDPELVEPCWGALKAEGQDPEFQGIVDEIKSGHAIFWGMRNEDSLRFAR